MTTRRSFAKCLAGIAALFTLPWRKLDKVKFYWVYETGEIYAARSLDDLNAELDKELGTDFAREGIHGGEWVSSGGCRSPEWEPRLTTENHGERWGPVGEDTQFFDDEEATRMVSLRQFVAEHPRMRIPCQMCTTYA